MSEEDRHVQSLASALSILDAYDGDVSLRLKDLHERTGLNRSRILRFAGTLRACGYLHFDEASNAYVLGHRLHAIGSMLQRSRARVLAVVDPVLERLMLSTGDTAFFSSIHNDKRLVVARRESNEGLRFIVEAGQTRPLHAGASSKVLLAFSPAAYRQRILAELDISDEDKIALDRELDDIRTSGCAVSKGAVTPHGFAVAAPVENGTEFPDVLTLAGPLGKLTDALATEYIEELTRESRDLGRALTSFRDSAGKNHRNEQGDRQ